MPIVESYIDNIALVPASKTTPCCIALKKKKPCCMLHDLFDGSENEDIPRE